MVTGFDFKPEVVLPLAVLVGPLVVRLPEASLRLDLPLAVDLPLAGGSLDSGCPASASEFPWAKKGLKGIASR